LGIEHGGKVLLGGKLSKKQGPEAGTSAAGLFKNGGNTLNGDRLNCCFAAS